MKYSRKNTRRKTYALPKIKFEQQRLTSFAGLVVWPPFLDVLDFKAHLRRCFNHIGGGKVYGRATLFLQLIIHLLLGYRELRDSVHYQDDPLVHDKGTARLGTEAAAAIKWTLSHASDLELPLLIIHGTGDRIVPYRASQAFFEQVPAMNKEYHALDGVYHEAHNDVGWEGAVAIIEDWIGRHR